MPPPAYAPDCLGWFVESGGRIGAVLRGLFVGVMLWIVPWLPPPGFPKGARKGGGGRGQV